VFPVALEFAVAEPEFLARAFALSRFQRRSFKILPIDALVGLFQLPPMLSLNCARVGAAEPSDNARIARNLTAVVFIIRLLLRAHQTITGR
jgi:hypothetical protein